MAGRSNRMVVSSALCATALAVSAVSAGWSSAEPAGAYRAAHRVAPRSAPDGALGSFSPLGSGLNNVVWALALRGDDTLYVGGEFTSSNGGAANSLNRIAAWDDTWIPLGAGASNGVSNLVTALAVRGDDTLYVGGNFDSAAGQPAGSLNRIAAWDDTWISLGSGANNGLNDWVRTLAVSGDDTVYVGGHFTSSTGGAANSLNKIAAWDDTWVALGSGAGNGLNDIVRTLALLDDDTLFVGGAFTLSTNGAVNSLRKAAAWDDTWIPLGSGANNGLDSSPSASAVFRDDTVLFGGGFSASAGGSPLKKIAGWRGGWSAFVSASGNGLDSTVDAIVTDDTRGLVYVGGWFAKATGGTAGSLNYITAWDAGINAWIPFTVAGGANGVSVASVGQYPNVVALALDDSVLYLGGNFTTAGGVAGFGNVARWAWDPPQGSNAVTAAPGTSVQVSGEGLVGIPPIGAVTLGAQPVTYVRDDSTHLTLNVPVGMAPGTHAISVNAVGGPGDIGTVQVPATPVDPPAPTPAGPPLQTKAVAGDGSAVVSWTEPATAGSYPVSYYQASSSPGGGTCLVAAPITQCSVSPLKNGVSYTFTVRALTGAGWGTPSAPSDPVTPIAPARPSLVISGSRDPADGRFVLVTGSAVGLTGQEVTAWVRRGRGPFRQGVAPRIVGEDGSFTWRRWALGPVEVYFAHGVTRSNVVLIPAAGLPPRRCRGGGGGAAPPRR
ncbi:MAG: fibronectin type III domain-containing protein [bacterium]